MLLYDLVMVGFIAAHLLVGGAVSITILFVSIRAGDVTNEGLEWAVA